MPAYVDYEIEKKEIIRKIMSLEPSVFFDFKRKVWKDEESPGIEVQPNELFFTKK